MIQLILVTGGRSGKSWDLLFPESWDELTGDQLQQLAGALMGIPDPARQKVEVSRILLQLDPKFFRKISPAVLCEYILPLCKWVHDDIEFTGQLLPVIQLQGLDLHGPKSQLANLRLIEWDFTERLLGDWVTAEDKIGTLARLCAVLYRPSKPGYDFERDPEGDCRLPFNDNLIEYYAGRISRELPARTLLAVLFWYRGCRKAITEAFSQVFTGNAGKGPAEPGYFDLMRVIAKEGTYGDFEKVEQLYLYSALQEIRAAKDEAERIRLAHKK